MSDSFAITRRFDAPRAGAVAPPHRGHLIRHFTPQWFAATMGTGILSIALAQFPGLPLLHGAGQGLWGLDIGLFALFTVLYGLRWVLWPQEAARILAHPLVSMFFGCIPMGLATIINGFLIYGPALIGPAAVEIAHGLWWLDAAMAVACGLGVPFLMFTRQDHAMGDMSAVWLLPIVACEVASVSGGMLLPHLGDPAVALRVLLTSYVLWALSVPLALSLLVVLFLRMALHKLPPVGIAASSWLTLGPIGTGALSLFTLYQSAPAVLTASGFGAFAAIAGDAGLLGGVLLWGYGLWWMAVATLITLRYRRAGRIPFNIGWWGYTFPLGVYAVATLKLAAILPIGLVAEFGAVLVAALAGLWLVIAARTLGGALSRRLFLDPALAG